MKLRFLGAAGTVTGSCFHLETAQSSILVDCGLFQGTKDIRERNYGSFLVPPRNIDAVLITHAHIDHCGLFPKLVKYGFQGRVYATYPTVELMKVLLPDSGHIQEMEVERKNRKNRRAGRPLLEPIYTVNEAYQSLSNLQGVGYKESIQVAPDIRARFVDAGHILGSSMIELWVQENGKEIKLVFSGDIGNNEQPIVKDPSTIDTADYLIMESTYGNRLHHEPQDEIELLREAIQDTYQKGGNLIIPAFAVERTQDLLYHLSLLIEQNKIPPMPVYIDSPLAAAATGIFQNHPEYYDQETSDLINRGGSPFQFPGIKFTQTAEESKSLNNISRAIIISASGMCDAGRIRHHLKYNLWRPESTVLFVGYQAEGTLGRQIVDGEKKVRIFGDDIAVKADIRFIDSYSAHADQAGLIAWVKKFSVPPGEVLLVHGEPESTNTLAGLLRAEGLKVTVPEWRQVLELLPGSYMKAALDPVHTAIFALDEKIKTALAAGIEESRKDELLRRIAELQQFVEENARK
ncbi:Ribonuclease [Pelotomaculum sp. FP]|uniref:MBL fold metallo-hydrolase RNA specificity domain-containing protein n=1 Tax=Pelotomaculum sp. FP TaxID=261474 RepID=UPI001064BAF9|nr:MBL fold metallo-hydrolase [Pelotomaculum sp. FP]TEB17976.1 Ribonuclease [Pelotomaculum sp. FP]